MSRRGCAFDPANSAKIVDLTDFEAPRIVGGFPVAGRARGVTTTTLAIDGQPRRLLLVLGGGFGEFPILRLYDIEFPREPTLVGGVILNSNLAANTTPVDVEVQGNYAYVGTIGVGLQVVDLVEALRVGELSFAEQSEDERGGKSALAGGFQLPNGGFIHPVSNITTPLDGMAAGVTAAFSGIALTGGLSRDLHVLTNTSPGNMQLIPQPGAALTYTMPADIFRIDAIEGVVVDRDDDGDGDIDRHETMNLAAVSHLAGGVSLLNLSNPNSPQLLSHLVTGSTVRDIAMAPGYLFTGDRMIAIGNPNSPLAGSPLRYEAENGLEIVLQNGSEATLGAEVLVDEGRRRLIGASATSNDRSVQFAKFLLPRVDRDWDILRTEPLEPVLFPDNREFLHLGDPVNPYTGEFTMEETDLAIQGRGLDFVFKRTYRSQNIYNGPIGFGWEHNYNDRLSIEPPGTGPGLFHAVRYDGTGRIDRFICRESDSPCDSPRGVFAELTKISGTANIQLEEPNGTTRIYEATDDSFTRYRLKSIRDRSELGNELEFLYDDQGRLAVVRDVWDRPIGFGYDDKGRLSHIRDFGGRVVRYHYDWDDNLIAVTKPPVTDFPEGKTTVYRYTAGFAEYDSDGEPLAERALNHNLLSVTDPNGDKYLSLRYGLEVDPNHHAFDRVISQTLGSQELVGDVGNPDHAVGGTYGFAYNLDSNGRVASAVTTSRSGATTERIYSPTGELQRLKRFVSGFPEPLETQYFYDDQDGLLEKTVNPRRTEVTRVYDVENDDRKRQGDLLSMSVDPGPEGDGEIRTWRYLPGPFGVNKQIFDPENHRTTQEVDEYGNVVSITRPTATLAASPGGSVERQVSVERFAFGDYNELLIATAADGVATKFNYFAADDGTPGYLKSTIEDAAESLSPRLIEATPLAIETS